jgi:peptidoglycan/xylan/chitin deacetylase (PgdA/CDA1 family)
LVFTGHTFAESGQTILDELKRRHTKASFFLTGAFLANTNFTPLVVRIVNEGHYLGPHSDQHLLYCSWNPDHKTLVSYDAFKKDLLDNVERIVPLGIPRGAVRYFLPAYEHYNQQIADWSAECGLALINFTPGTRSNADYTNEADTNFVSSATIFDSITNRERQDPNGLNGYLLLLHLGSGPGRADKFHPFFRRLLDHLSAKGYQFVRVDELLQSAHNK